MRLSHPAGLLRCAGRGFTLIELLVVVSIIALLVSVLLPGLREARETGKRTLCLTNLRQIGTAMGSYCNEYADIFPWFADYEYRKDLRTYQSWYYGGRYPPLPMVAGVLRFYPEQRPLNAYLYPNAAGLKAEAKIYSCPSEDGLRGVTPGSPDFHHDPRPGYLTIGTSYIANWWWIIISGLQATKESAKLSLLPDYANNMTRYKLSVRGAGIFGVLYGDPLDTMIVLEGPFRGWHKKVWMSEMLFLDGHADFLPTRTFRGYRYKTAEWTLWFNEKITYVPEQFLPPFPGIEEYVPPE